MFYEGILGILSLADVFNKVLSFPSYQFKLLQEEYELSDTDNAVKVHTDKPHLVSLGSGRLSTAVTILPLQEGTYLYDTILPPQESSLLYPGLHIANARRL